MLRKLVVLLLLVFSVGAVNAQTSSFFKPLKKQKLIDKYGLYSFSVDSVIKSFRPVAVISATVSDGAQLAGGAGIGYQSNKWDAASGSYITQYSVSLVGLLGTTGTVITGTGGIIVGIPGTNGMIGIGGGRDFTQKQWVIITGVQIKFN